MGQGGGRGRSHLSLINHCTEWEAQGGTGGWGVLSGQGMHPELYLLHWGPRRGAGGGGGAVAEAVQ